ncbi:MAG: preprotein translocase subunit SecE [Candidatus Saccharimonadales bacterium]
MAENPAAKAPKRRIVKKAATVREQLEKKRSKAPKERGVAGLTLYYVSWPFRTLGRGLAKVGRFVVPKYFRQSWAELRQVTWPSWKDTWKLTFAVILFSIVFGVFITVVDIGLDKVFRKALID